MAQAGSAGGEIISTMATDVSEKRRADGSTALIRAALVGDLWRVKQLIERGADINAKDNWGRNALIVAAVKGHLDVIQTLLDGEANINGQNHNGMTALIEATLNGQEEAVKVLLRYGAEIGIKNKRGDTALDFAKRYPRIELLLQKTKSRIR
jgi:ankyrin repeat protein